MARSFVHVEDRRHHVGVKMEKRGSDHGHKADFHFLAKLDPASFSTTLISTQSSTSFGGHVVIQYDEALPFGGWHLDVWLGE